MREIKKLLSEAFGDTPEYLDSLESLGLLRSEDSFIIYDGSVPVSCFFTKKYPLNLSKNTVWADYIYYAATKTSYRNIGLMKRLITESLSCLKTRGGYCAVLIPAERTLFEYYGSLGFKTSFYVKKKEFFPGNRSGSIYVPSSVEAKKCYSRYYQKYGMRDHTLFKTEELFCISVDENLLGYDNCTVLSDGMDIAFVKIGDNVEIREYTGSDESLFAETVAEKFQRKVIVSSATRDNNEPVGMMILYCEDTNNQPLYADNMLN